MFARRLRLPQCPVRRCCCHREPIARLSTGRPNENSSSSDSSSSSSSSAPSLYEKLFSSKSTSSPNPRPRRPSSVFRQSVKLEQPPTPSSPQRGRNPGHAEDATKTESPSETETPDYNLSDIDELKAWFGTFKDEVQTRVKSESAHGEETVVIVSSVSRSLLESDFYRIAEQGKHVAGWAGGITKVIQSVSPLTREPRGQYFIFFDTRAAAEAYLDKLNTLMVLTKRADDRFHSPPPKADLPTPAGEDATEPKKKESSPDPDSPPSPSVPFLEIRDPPRLMSATELANTIASAAVSNFRSFGGGPGRLRSSKDRDRDAENWQQHYASSGVTAPLRLAAHLRLGRALTADDGTGVLVRFVGSKITIDAMLEALWRDSLERNREWRLVANTPEGPRPVQRIKAGSSEIREGEFAPRGTAEVGESAEEEGEEEEASGGKNTARRERRQVGHTRFVLTFVDKLEARRFARAWHKREMLDERTGRTMIVNATVLM